MVTDPLAQMKKELAQFKQEQKDRIAKEGGRRVILIEKAPKGSGPLFGPGELVDLNLILTLPGFSLLEQKQGKKQIV